MRVTFRMDDMLLQNMGMRSLQVICRTLVLWCSSLPVVYLAGDLFANKLCDYMLKAQAAQKSRSCSATVVPCLQRKCLQEDSS